jgi:pSer/pThr/pTyr-binding forkhead associated (FHA) protein
VHGKHGVAGSSPAPGFMPTVFLDAQKGPATGATYPVTREATIGRGTGADIVVPDESVSRVHASVRVDGQTAVVEDLDSSNGTFVNGNQINSPCRVTPGDVVLVGATELEVRLEDGDGSGPMTPSAPTVIHPAPEA